jgi:DNA polymerase-4
MASAQIEMRERLSRVLDEVTQRYGRDALTVGLTGNDGRSFTGTKIAFNRIPDATDFEGSGGARPLS